jgi:hypothetical protein
MSRHPYTYACDFIRGLGPVGAGGVVLSRADASQIRQGIAAAIGMDDEELAMKLSIAEQSKTEEQREEQVTRLINCLNFTR